METFLFILFIPIAIAFIAKRVFRHTITFKEMGLQVGISVVVISIVWFAGTASQTRDVEIWNGQVVKKQRVHDEYTESYQCNCRTVSCGKNCTTTQCSTCYRDHYTVDWSATTTIGNVTFQHLDRTSRSVYQSPDPQSYIRCVPGEPASLEKAFTNYVKAVPESLFHDNSRGDSELSKKVPAYPRVYGFYRIHRVLNVDSKVSPDVINRLNTELSNDLKTLGRSKQVNIIVILTEIDDPTYRYAVERKWLGGKKNDVVIFLGLDDNKITWTDVMTWAMNKGNELFHVTMRDGLMKIGDVTNPEVAPFIAKTITKLYDRPQMKDFEYLEDQIDPPTWVVMLCVILAIFGSAGLTYWFHKQDVA